MGDPAPPSQKAELAVVQLGYNPSSGIVWQLCEVTARARRRNIRGEWHRAAVNFIFACTCKVNSYVFHSVYFQVTKKAGEWDKRNLNNNTVIIRCWREGRDFAWPKSGDISRKESSWESQNRLNVPIRCLSYEVS